MRRNSYLTKQAARGRTMPAPVGGWDTKSSLASMPEKNAVVLDNWFPERDKVVLRNGTTAHATFPEEFTSEFTSEFTRDPAPAVETLMEYVPSSGSAKLFAGCGSTIYDVSTAGEATDSAGVGFSSSYFVHTQFGNSAGHYLFAANGMDAMQVYNGSAWSAAAISGPTMANIAWVATHQNRLWFGEKESLAGYYLAAAAISGTANSFDLSGVAKLGGYLVGMGTWTRDGGAGLDDIAVFLTSEGECVIYQGSDPSSSTTWSLIGVFRIGRPLNRRCIIKAGSDLVIGTESGIIPLSQTLAVDRSQTALAALSDQINQAFSDAVRDAAGLTDYWHLLVYPRLNMLIVNVPRANADSVQFVFNTLTGAPARFTGIPANCWALLNDRAFYGGAGAVVKFDDGSNDMGQPIVGDAVQAFSYFSSPGAEKRFSRVQPVITAVSDPEPSIDIMTNFEITSPSPLRGPSTSTSSLWDVAYWDVDYWDSAAATIWGGWEAVNAHGRSAAIRMRVNSLGANPEWIATNWLITGGGPL